MRRSRLIYSAVVRPTVLYGAQIWGTTDGSGAMPKSRIKALKKDQNQCLRKVLGAYKRTPTAALEREAAVPLSNVYIPHLAAQRALTISGFPVTEAIRTALNDV